MSTLPVPFAVAFLLLVLAAANHPTLKATATGRTFAWVLYLKVLGMLLVGIRWQWDVVAVLPIVATISVASSVLLYLAFLSLGRHDPVVHLRRDRAHLYAVLGMALVALAVPVSTEAYLVVAKIVYASLFIRLAREMPVSLQRVRLSWLTNSQKALWAAAALQLNSIVVDIAIIFDFVFFEGRHAADLVGLVSLMILFLLGYAAVLAGRGHAGDTVGRDHKLEDDKVTSPHSFAWRESINAVETVAETLEPVSQEAGDEALMVRLDALLTDDRLYADTELNLQRLARKAGVPGRAVSRAINSRTGMNLSQWVNRARIDAACELLRVSEASVSDAMLAAGFLTKSNFNREFRRIKGCSPSEWRDAVNSDAS